MNRVFVGLGNTGYNATYISRALREIGIYSYSYSYNNVSFGKKTDFSNILFKKSKNKFLNIILRRINKLLKLIFFLRMIIKYDVFIFISKYTFLNKNIDLAVLKILRKQIAFVFPGCVERNPEDEINRIGICSRCNDFIKQKYCHCYKPEKESIIRKIEKYADYIFNQKDTRGFLRLNGCNHFFYATTGYPEQHKEELLKKYDSVEKIKILHLPSNPKMKNTEIVNKVMNKLLENYTEKVEYINEKMDNKKVLNMMEESHILIDQFNGGYGMLCIEGMARGCVVVVKISPWFREDLPDLPLESTEPDELYDRLCYYIENPDEMKKIADSSIDFFEEYHSLVNVGNYYKNIMDLN